VRPALLLVLLSLAGGALAAALAMSAGAQEVGLSVLAVGDPSWSARVTSLQVRVDNPGPLPVSPVFTTPANALLNPFSWNASGPGTVPPGGNATFDLTTPPWTGIPEGVGFRVVVTDAHGRAVRGESDLARADPPGDRPSALNPGFASWIPSMIAPYSLPYGWVPEIVLHGSDRFAIDGRDGAAHLSLDLDINRTKAEGGPEDWSMVALRQRIDFPRTFRVELGNGTRSDHAVGPRTIVGVSLEDVYGKTQVLILFSERPTAPDQPSEALLRFGDFASRRVLVTNRTIEVDMVKLYEDAGWKVPDRQHAVREATVGPEDVGLGAGAMPGAYEQLSLQRPLELRVLVASFPPHERERVEATFSYVGGPALDPSPSS